MSKQNHKTKKKCNCNGLPAFKSQREGSSSNQTLHHYQHSKISSINKFTIDKQQILGSHELKGQGHF